MEAKVTVGNGGVDVLDSANIRLSGNYVEFSMRQISWKCHLKFLRARASRKTMSFRMQVVIAAFLYFPVPTSVRRRPERAGFI